MSLMTTSRKAGKCGNNKYDILHAQLLLIKNYFNKHIIMILFFMTNIQYATEKDCNPRVLPKQIRINN